MRRMQLHQCQVGFEFWDPSSDQLDQENAFQLNLEGSEKK